VVGEDEDVLFLFLAIFWSSRHVGSLHRPSPSLSKPVGPLCIRSAIDWCRRAAEGQQGRTPNRPAVILRFSSTHYAKSHYCPLVSNERKLRNSNDNDDTNTGTQLQSTSISKIIIKWPTDSEEYTSGIFRRWIWPCKAFQHFQHFQFTNWFDIFINLGGDR